MPVEPRFVPRFVAEPPQEPLPYGRWADRLRHEFLGACLRVEPDDGEDLGEPGDIVWYPDRTWDGRTYVPGTTRTSGGFELFGYVSFTPGDGDTEEPSALVSVVALDASASETGTNPGSFRLTRTGTVTQLASALTVSFTLTGTALNGTVVSAGTP